mgnify:CR=1 FL=1
MKDESSTQKLVNIKYELVKNEYNSIIQLTYVK